MSGKTALFPRNDRPYGLKRAAFQTENALKHSHKFIAAESGCKFIGGEFVAQSLCKLNQYFIAYDMAIRVIYALELIYIHDADKKPRLIRRIGVGQVLFKSRVDCFPKISFIIKPRKVVNMYFDLMVLYLLTMLLK